MGIYREKDERRYNSGLRLSQTEQYKGAYLETSNILVGLRTKIREAGKDPSTKISSGLRENQSDLVDKSQKLKRKLLVYKKDDKFYIDKSAAYALNLTSVRAIMIDKPQLFEVRLDFLLKMQNDPDVEIEYQELNKEKEKVTTNKSGLKESLEGLEQEEYGIGVHGIQSGSIEEMNAKGFGIIQEGLNMGNNSKTVLSTAISLGTNDKSQDLANNISEYRFGNGPKGSAVIAVPLYIQNKNGEKIFLGFPEKNNRTAGQQYEEHCILDKICGKLNRIPAEFILGYCYGNRDVSEGFERNMSHYSNLSDEAREELYELCVANMDEISKSINEAISTGDIDRLTQMREQLQERDMHTYMVDNAIELAQNHSRQQEQKTSEIKDPNISGVKKGSSERRILLDLYEKSGVTKTDAQAAKGNLAQGIKSPTRKVLIDRG